MISKYSFLTLILFALLQACKEDESFENPYSGGKEPLGVKFNSATPPSPAEAMPGSTVVFAAAGIQQYKDQLTFTFNGEPAEIVAMTETSITVKVPENASSGAATINVDDQVFFGPQFKVIGKVTADPFYKGILGAEDVVRTVFQLKDGRYILGGDFVDYNNQANDVSPIRRIVLTSTDGEVDKSFRFGQGVSGYVSSIAANPNQSKLYIAGEISGYDKLNRFINNITSTLSNGAGDSVNVLTYNKKLLAVPAFNGGTSAPISRVFYQNDKIVAVGNFSYYLTRNFSAAKKPYTNLAGEVIVGDSVIVDSAYIRQVLRFNLDGSLDKSYRFVSQVEQSLPAGNGTILASHMQADGKLILVGNFTRFDGVNVGRIVRLDENGVLDQSFNTGSGANGSISSITFNNITKKFLLTGTFGSFNGTSAKNMVMLNEDGSIDNSFVALDFDNGFPSFAKQISNGLILVSGGFKKYNGIKRQGLVFLTPTGALAAGYNTLGEFNGVLTDVVERRNQDNKITLLLPGNYTRFDGKLTNRITSIVLD